MSAGKLDLNVRFVAISDKSMIGQNGELKDNRNDLWTHCKLKALLSAVKKRKRLQLTKKHYD